MLDIGDLIKIIVFVGIIFLWIASAFLRVFLSPPEAGRKKPVLPGEGRPKHEGLLGEATPAAPTRTAPAEGLLDYDETTRSRTAERQETERRFLERTSTKRPPVAPEFPRAPEEARAASKPSRRPAARVASAEAEARARARRKQKVLTEAALASAARRSEPAADTVEAPSAGLVLGLDPEAAFILKEVLGPPRAHRKLPWGPPARRR